MKAFFKNLTRSLSVKLTGIFLVAAIMLAWLLWFLLDISFERQFSDNVKPYLSKYIFSLQEQVGYPPNIRVAQEITKNKPINIVIDAPTYRWSSNGDFIEKPYLDVKVQRTNDTGVVYEAGFYKGNFILRNFNRGYITSFIVQDKLKRIPRLSDIITIILASLVFVMLLYFVTYKLFQPIGYIRRGVNRIGKGEVDYRLSVNRNDEFGELSTSINKMANNIEEMLEAKRQLLLSISHELRTPITRAKLALSLIDEEFVKQSALEDMDEMETLIHELLESERLREKHTPLQLEDNQINGLIEQVTQQYFKDQPIQLDLDKQLPVIAIDKTRISLAIKNLIKNAVMASKTPDSPIWVKTTFDTSFIDIQVSDSGVGIDKKHIPHLTEPFYRTDSSRQRKTGGFGIGLYLIKAIVDAHHGELIIRSEVNKGTDVTIKLPYSREHLHNF